MLIVTLRLFINQVPTADFPNRSYEFDLDFAEEFEANNSWRDFTDELKITLPKNFAYTDSTGTVILNPANTAVNIGGFSANVPLFMKGDEVTLVAGYIYTLNNQTITDTAIIFSGYVRSVTSKKPYTLACEDFMFKLKQLPTPNKLFPSSSYTLETMLAELVKPLGYVVNQNAQTSIGDFRCQNETVADVLSRLHKDYHFISYFGSSVQVSSGNNLVRSAPQLFSGPFVVYQTPGNTYSFVFQQNIIDDELEYARQDDVVLSALAYSVNRVEVEATTKDGATKTKHQRLECLVTYQNGKFTAKINPPGQNADFPANYTGERRCLYFWNVTDPNKLVALAKSELQRYYYSGLRGKFTTFGVPFVRQGDIADIYDTILPERNGRYMIKSVQYKFSVNDGLRQVVELDYRVGDNLLPQAPTM
jgi:hypothetical protein